ncbi:ArsB/NhaD family transporter [Deinococcus oregonensis]|uniref:ArsB/NhaD family transporter n=1 Tax=Deinococcus oregonensis TaxID=1805970 RepID=A0ABV6B323_9DEIO
MFSALVAALFANDGGMLILTPIVLEVALLLGVNRAATLAFALAVGFVVDAAIRPGSGRLGGAAGAANRAVFVDAVLAGGWHIPLCVVGLLAL